MSPELNNITWHPSTTLETLQKRAELLADIRAFFQKKNVLEVETPLLCRSAALDPFLQPIPVVYKGYHSKVNQTLFLQTSPEFPMKRLLAAGGGSIYQICKAFRNDEVGRLHNPEFTMLEWYRLGFDHDALMDEVDELFSLVLNCPKAERLSYKTVFENRLEINPLKATLAELIHCAVSQNITIDKSVADTLTIDDWLDLLMTHCIEPHLGFERPVMIYDFPASKAALAKVREGDGVAERFEVYIQGIELANGYHELTDPEIQIARFKQDCKMREELGLASIPIDDYLIAALKAGFPDCAGVALGIDRLLMLKLNCRDIKEVISFTIDRA